MGVTANPVGKFGGQMRKIKNRRDAEIYSEKHNDKKQKKEESKETKPED